MREKKARLKLRQQEESWSVVYCLNFTNEDQKTPTSSFSSLVVSVVILQINKLSHVNFIQEKDSKHIIYCIWGNWRLFGSASQSTNLSKWKQADYSEYSNINFSK